LPAAVVPVLIGSGVAAGYGAFSAWRAAFALLVALLLQVGVNFANDYSDGVRGTDAAGRRAGPMRLVGSGAAAPKAVKYAAFCCFAAACCFGLALAAVTSWWLVAGGALCVLAAWFYTGGSRPYGYRGLGELSVFLFSASRRWPGRRLCRWSGCPGSGSRRRFRPGCCRARS
jgi:1,4-dihydroxy-2-naphthoate octaprenyltransferase